MHSNKSWDDLTKDRDSWMRRAQKAEGDLQALGKDGALGRLGAQIDDARIAATRERESWTTRLDVLKRENAALRRQLAAQPAAPRKGVRLSKAPRGTVVSP